MKKNSKKKTPIWKSSSFYFILVYALLTILIIGQLLKVNVLPTKYLAIIGIILILLLLVLYYLQMGKRVSNLNRILGKILIVILSIGLGVGNWYLFKTGSAFSSITGNDENAIAISVIVLDKNPAKEISDLKKSKFGITSVGDQEHTLKAIEDIEKDIDDKITKESYKSYIDFAKDLYDGKVDAIILNEGSRGLIQDNHPNFDKETRIIKTFKYKSENKSVSKSVNVTEDPFNVYISGIDTYGGISTVSRSDVNMIATVNPNTKQILLTSIPRDYYVSQPCQGGQKDKLTHTGIFGVDCTIKTAEGFMGIDINYYARVNFSSLVKIVDSIGGIQVDNPQAFDSAAKISFSAGNMSLNGEEALAFSRERYAFEDGDRERGRNQMRVITGIINKLTSPAIITNYASVMDAIGGSFQTNMGTNDITSLIKQQLNTMDGWDIEQIAVNGTGNPSAWSPANGFNSWVMEPDKKSIDNATNIIEKVHAGELVKTLVKDMNATPQ